MISELYRTFTRKDQLIRFYNKINDDHVFNGAAALAYYSLFSFFPGMIFLLTIVPYLPIDNLHQAIMEFLAQVMPSQVTKQLEGIIAEITLNKRSGLLSIGAILTLWSASSGMYALMEQLDMTYEVKEQRPFWKARGLAILLTMLLGVMVLVSFALIVLGGVVQTYLANYLGQSDAMLVLFQVFRWVIIFTLLTLSFAVTYYFGPDVEQRFKFITPGALFGVVVLVGATLLFRFYVENFGDYAATYGSLGAVIVLMLLLYIGGLVVLVGSSINAMIEHKSPDGKNLGEKTLASSVAENSSHQFVTQ
jgi:membrane protein